ncbi:MAG: carbohydrate-binding protein [Verrucomicrobia bacterium]|jgi:hypothetical protein|nr:carbohydrate-binding protein [Verrucomicrobiota bacterium]
MKTTPRPWWRAACALVSAALFLSLAPQTAEANTRIGTNLSSIKDWNTQPFFYNLMHHSRGWVARDNTTGPNRNWGFKSDDRNGLIPQRTSDGYPTQVPFTAWGNNAWVFTFVPLYETGSHKLQVTGSGQIKWKAPGQPEQTRNLNGGTSTFFFDVDSVNDLSQFKSGTARREGPSKMTLEITQSNSGDPVRDIRIMRPGHHGAGKHAFDADFKNYLSFYDTLRFMDWGETNNSPLVDWSDRTKKDWYSQTTEHGVAYEHMIQLANELNKDLWINVPHKADNNFVDNMASLFNNQTEGARDIFLEYSNEVWNGMFDQSGWVNNSNFAGSNRMEKYGTRSAQIFDRWYAQFNNPGDRVVRVIAGQAANDWQTLQALETAGTKTDAIAIAPYFGNSIKPEELTNPLPSKNDLANEPWLEMNQVQDALDSHAALAQDFGVQLIAYEGGQHYVGIFGTQDNDDLTDLLLDFNRSWQIRNIYRWDYLNRLGDSGMLLFCSFASVGDSWNKFGSWPTMEYWGQPINNSEGNAVKEWALRDWKANNPDGADVQPGSGGGGGGGGGAGEGVRIEAENYTAMSGIQTQNTSDSGGGQNVGWIDNGDWMDYAVDVPSSGSYVISFRVASPNSGAQFALKSGGSTLATVNVPDTGNWQNWQTVTATANLNAGSQTLRIQSTANPGWNINWWEFSGGSGGGGGGGGSVTFNDKSEGDVASSYSAEGLTVTVLAFNGSASSIDFLSNNYPSTVARPDNWNESFRIVASNGGSFNLAAFDHGAVWSNNYDATITGTKSGGGTVTASISGNSNNPSTKTLNWSNLTEVVIDYGGGVNNRFGVIDNLDQGN